MKPASAEPGGEAREEEVADEEEEDEELVTPAARVMASLVG